MGLKKYFDILGLIETATPVDIRKQYRKLAMRFHPDKNPSTNAKEQFLLITDAYEILIGKKSAPKNSLTHISRSKEKTNDDRLREAKKRYYEQVYKEHQENERYFKSLFRGKKWKIIKMASILGPFFSLLILLDFFSPNHYEEDRVAFYATSMKNGELLVKNSLIRTEKGNDYWISNMDYKLYGVHPDIYVERSWFLHQPAHIISIQKISYAYYPVNFTFLSMSAGIIPIFCLPLFIRLFKRKKVWYTVLYQLSLYLSTGMILYFLLSNDHWAHILTFGFL